MPAVARRGTVRAVLTALLVDVLGALGEGNDLVAGEDLGAVCLLAARGAEGLAAGVAEAHGIQILRGHSGAVVVVRGGGGTAGGPAGCQPPAHPLALTALAQRRSQLAHCTSSSPSAELSTRNCRSRSTGGKPVPPLTTEGCLRDGDGDRDRARPQPFRRAQVGTVRGRGCGPRVPVRGGAHACPRPRALPAEGAAQAAVGGAAAQAAGTEIVVAVEQAGVLEGLVAQQAHQRVPGALLQLRAAPQRGEDAPGHPRGSQRGDPGPGPSPAARPQRCPGGAAPGRAGYF